MELFCKFSVQSPMDMHPTNHVRTFIADSEDNIREAAIKWADQMNHMPCSEHTTFVKVMNKEEAEAHIKEVCDYEDQHPQEDSNEFKDKIVSLFNKCYNESN